MDITITIPDEVLEKGLQATGFYEQTDITDKNDWIVKQFQDGLKSKILAKAQRDIAEQQRQAQLLMAKQQKEALEQAKAEVDNITL